MRVLLMDRLVVMLKHFVVMSNSLMVVMGVGCDLDHVHQTIRRVLKNCSCDWHAHFHRGKYSWTQA